jgi:hypothetical protein
MKMPNCQPASEHLLQKNNKMLVTTNLLISNGFFAYVINDGIRFWKPIFFF